MSRPLINRASEKILLNQMKTLKEILKQNIYLCNIASMIIVIVLGLTHIWYALLYLPLYGCFLLWLNWDHYIMGLEMIETRLWGRPLPDFKAAGKPRPKLKFVWDKRKHELNAKLNSKPKGN